MFDKNNYFEVTPNGIIIKSAELPPGVWYDKEREQYRVRVYYKRTIWYLKYHEDLKDALLDWYNAQRKLEECEDAPPRRLVPNSYDTIIPFLKAT